MEPSSASPSSPSSSSSVRFRFRESKRSKQKFFLQQQQHQTTTTRSERTETHDGLEDYSESEANSEFEGVDHLSSSFSSLNSGGSSFSSSFRDSLSDFQQAGSTSNHSQSYRQQFKGSKPWMKESAMPFNEGLTDLNEEDDEDDDEDDKAAGTSGDQRKLGRSESEQIDRNIYFLKEPDGGAMKAAYYMSRLRAWSLQEDGIYRSEIVKAGGIEAVISTMWMQLLAYDTEMSNETEGEDGVVEEVIEIDDDDEQSIEHPQQGDEDDDDDNDELYFLRVQQLGIACLANIARDRSSCSLIMSSGGMEKIAAAMKKYPSNANVQEKGCDAIGTLARDQQARDKLVKHHDAVKLVLEAMETGAPDDVYVQRRGCIALFRLAAAGSASCTVIGKCGAVDVVLRTMRRHTEDAKIQRLGCGVLKALSKRVESNKSRIFATKGGTGLSTVLKAMTKHMGDSGVQEEACRLLGHLTICHLERKFAISRSGALERILSAMKRHKNSEKVQLAGCVALLNLTTKVELASMANSCGSIQVIRQAAKPHCPRQAKKLLTRLRIARYAPIVFVS
mmetsp:Transcript_19066/g.44829  ORF Transcript_19066/g.44829 Transcript_19066/m.44829 type:complete len:562 (+) Transcript_19066:294-1979(+)